MNLFLYKKGGRCPFQNFWLTGQKPPAVLFLFLLWASRAFAQAAIPANACILAQEDWQARANNPAYVYLWSPTASDEDYAAATVAINCSVSQSSSPYRLDRVGKGALIGVDLTQLADDQKGFERVTRLWTELAGRDPYFHYQTTTVIAADAKKKTAAQTISNTVVAPWTGEAGSVLSAGRIYRLDQFAAIALTSVDGGQYLRFRSLQAGSTTLGDYLKSRGADLKASEALNAVNSSAQISDVTANVRGIQLWHGQQSKPSDGAPLAAITNDAFFGRVDPNRNPFLSLLNSKHDAFELILTLPNGQQEFTLWSADGKLLAEADPRIATDHGVPDPFPQRLQCGLSCIRCHGKFSGWQPIDNQVLTLLGSGRIVTDLSKGTAKQFEALRLIQSRYGARQFAIDTAILSARNNLDRRYDELIAAKTEHAARDAYGAAAAVIDRYQHSWVNAEIAARELGIDPGKDAPAALRAALPAPSPVGAVVEGSAGIIARLQAGLKVTRAEFESAFPDAAMKAFATIVQKGKETKK